MSDLSVSVDADVSMPDWKTLVGDIGAKIHLGLNDANARLDKLIQLEQARLAALPNYVALPSKASVNATTNDIVSFGGPQPGRRWVVALLSGVANPIAANAAVVSWYIGTRMTQANLQVSDIKWQFASLPSFQTFSSMLLQVLPNQELFAGLTSVPASSNIVLNCTVNDQPLYNAYAPVST